MYAPLQGGTPVPRKSKNRGVNTTRRVETFSAINRTALTPEQKERRKLYIAERNERIAGVERGVVEPPKGTSIGNRFCVKEISAIPTISRPILKGTDARSWYTPSEKEE
jgi:hypothetical protein